jgi:hypothetical protein
VKLLGALRGVERRQLMRHPGDGVGFARTGAVLDEVFVARAFRPGGFPS